MLSRLLGWKTRSESTSPLQHLVQHVNQLPQEVLGEIFMQLPLNDRIRAATVCRLWRSVALDHAELWCGLHNVDTPVLSQLLSRTKEAGIRLTGKYSTPGVVQRLFWRITPHMGHLKHLDLRVVVDFPAAYYSAANLRSFFSTPAPLLETFKLVLEGIQYPVDFPLFSGVAPRLRTLRMEGWLLQVTSAATLNVVSLHAPGVEYHLQQPTYASFTASWSAMFPKVRELHLSRLCATIGLGGQENRFPMNLTTLVLELVPGIGPRLLDEPFAILQRANFANLRELTVVHAHAILVDRVLEAVTSVTSLEMLGDGGGHLRLITTAGAALNFMHVHVDGLDETLLKHSKLFEGLRTLHLDELVPHAFQPATLAQISLFARGLTRLRITLRADRAPQTIGLLLHPKYWLNALLSLRALDELHIEGASAAGGVPVYTDELAEFVCETLRVSSVRNVPRLVIVGIEIIQHREWCFVPGENLYKMLKAFFDEIVCVPHPRAVREKPHTQRAEMFMQPTYEYEL